jgi:ribonuclease-3
MGYERTAKKVLDFFAPFLSDLDTTLLKTDYKTLLQEYFQAKEGVTPTYTIIQEKGPDHKKEFIAIVTVKDKKMGEGKGFSKKEAQQEAARSAWESLGFITAKVQSKDFPL